MDFRAQTELISAVVALALATAVLLRARKRKLHWLYVAFAMNVALWYSAQFLRDQRGVGPWTGRLVALAALLLPQSGIRFVRSFVDHDPGRRSKLYRSALVLFAALGVAVASPYHSHVVTRSLLSLYFIGLFAAAVIELFRRGERANSKLDRDRARYLAGVGAVTTVVFATDLLPFAGLDVGPVGSTLVLVVLFLLSQVIERARLIDLYELTARLAAVTALAFILAGIYYVLVDWARGEAPYVLNAIVASLVILILFDPVRTEIERQVGRVFFRERRDFEQKVSALRERLAHVLELEDLSRELTEGLRASKRITQAALYLTDADRRALELSAHLGSEPPAARVELGAVRPLLAKLEAEGAVVVEQLARDAQEKRDEGDAGGAASIDDVTTACAQMGGTVLVPINSDEGALLGALAVGDDRMRGAFSTEDVQVLRTLAAQVGVVLANSKQHARIKERDRLAALGEMAAGLAHEIRNPLGSIKAAAQLMEDTAKKNTPEREYLDIILEEIDRLNRVVGSFLDYARPYRGEPARIDVNEAVQRTVKMLANDVPAGVTVDLQLGEEIPPVRIDAEHLRQVVMNLLRNAVEAMEGQGTITVVTQRRPGGSSKVEVVVRDTGPGIAAKDLPNLFIPFFTTKTQGTGLGLAISQRLIAQAGGRIEVRTQGGRGSSFVIVLPADRGGATASTPAGNDATSERARENAVSKLPAPEPGRVRT